MAYTALEQMRTVNRPRLGDDDGAEAAGTLRFLGDAAAFEEVLARTDEFNRLAETETRSKSDLLPPSGTRPFAPPTIPRSADNGT